MSDRQPLHVRKIGMNIPITVELLDDIGASTNGHVEVTPHTPEFLAARAEFVAKWEALELEGLRLGYLERESCYECAGEVVRTEDVEERDWVDD